MLAVSKHLLLFCVPRKVLQEGLLYNFPGDQGEAGWPSGPLGYSWPFWRQIFEHFPLSSCWSPSPVSMTFQIWWRVALQRQQPILWSLLNAACWVLWTCMGQVISISPGPGSHLSTAGPSSLGTVSLKAWAKRFCWQRLRQRRFWILQPCLCSLSLNHLR